jgi:hypothetical protein
MDEYGKDYGKGETLEKLLNRFKGQPIEVLTSDGVRYCGIELACGGDGLEIIDKRSRVIFIPFRHIDAVVEPKMKLTCFSEKVDCEREECEKD